MLYGFKNYHNKHLPESILNTHNIIKDIKFSRTNNVNIYPFNLERRL